MAVNHLVVPIEKLTFFFSLHRLPGETALLCGRPMVQNIKPSHCRVRSVAETRAVSVLHDPALHVRCLYFQYVPTTQRLPTSKMSYSNVAISLRSSASEFEVKPTSISVRLFNFDIRSSSRTESQIWRR